MVLKKTARGVQMDRQAILSQDPATAPADPAPAETTEPVVDLRPPAPEHLVPAAARLAPARTAAPKPPAGTTPKRQPRPKPVPVPDRGRPGTDLGMSVTILLTQEQWDWVLSEAKRRGIAQRYVLLSAVDKHRTAIADHFRTTVQEATNLFHWTGEPKDVEGAKVGRPIRILATEREILQGLVDEVDAPSLSMYLRIAADIEMREQDVTA
jgi:hypothetical protein